MDSIRLTTRAVAEFPQTSQCFAVSIGTSSELGDEYGEEVPVGDCRVVPVW